MAGRTLDRSICDWELSKIVCQNSEGYLSRRVNNIGENKNTSNSGVSVCTRTYTGVDISRKLR